MTYHSSVKREYEQPNGIRRTELRYSGDIDTSGKLKLKRCVGKSFLDKDRKTGACLSTESHLEQESEIKTTRPVITSRPDQSA